MKRVVKLSSQSGDWEGLFIDGKLIDEGHHLGEGNSFTYLLKLSEEYKFTSDDVISQELNNEDEEQMEDAGNFPSLLTELLGTYDQD